MAIIGVGNEHYVPSTMGKAVRDYAAVFRFRRSRCCPLTNYVLDERGFPADPNPSRKLLLGWAAAPDHFENWTANRCSPRPRSSDDGRHGRGGQSASAKKGDIPGFLVAGTIENGATAARMRCPPTPRRTAHTFAGHTATDVPLSARARARGSSRGSTRTVTCC